MYFGGWKEKAIINNQNINAYVFPKKGLSLGHINYNLNVFVYL